MCSSPYSFRKLDQQLGSTVLRTAWQQLADASSSCEAIYLRPAFADFLNQCNSPHQRFHLLAAYAAGAPQRLGLIPVLHTGLAPRGLARWYQREQLVLLGSSPLLPAQTDLLDALHQFLLAEFPRVQALVYRALPQEHPIWQHLQQCPAALTLTLHGWRDCHTMPLPASYAAYLNQLGGKRRYNLKRQQRQLAAAAGGELEVKVIQSPAQLDLLEQGLRACCPPARRRHLWDAGEMLALAQHELLLCFRIDAGQQCCGVILGLQAGAVYHLFNILPAPQWQSLSAGTSILQLVLAYLCDHNGGHTGGHNGGNNSGQFKRIEFGYGQPGHSYQSSNSVMQRGHVLVLRDTPANRLLRRWHQGTQRLMHALRACRVATAS